MPAATEVAGRPVPSRDRLDVAPAPPYRVLRPPVLQLRLTGDPGAVDRRPRVLGRAAGAVRSGTRDTRARTGPLRTPAGPGGSFVQRLPQVHPGTGGNARHTRRPAGAGSMVSTIRITAAPVFRTPQNP